jgi:hypothetical protein
MTTRFFDPLLGRLIVMNFDFGKAMTRRHELAALAAPVTGDDFSHAMASDVPALFERLLVIVTGQPASWETK